MPSSMPLTLWTNQALRPDLVADFRARLTPHEVVWSADSSPSVLTPAGRDPVLVEKAEIAFGQPSPDDILASKNLKLVCLSSAGYTRYDNDVFRDGCRKKSIAVCNASGVYAEPCAQHLLAFMLAGARRLPEAAEVHANVRMRAAASAFRRPRRDVPTKSSDEPSFNHWPTLPLRAQSLLLTPDQTMLLVGYGAIAKRIAELLSPFRMNVHAFRRSPRGDENVPTHAIADLNQHLPSADHVVNILPLSDSTRNFFDAKRLAQFKPGARYYNIGRGDTNDQNALVKLLVDGHLAQAYLDVTSPEPLPMTDSLWLAPNCYITPHTAGGSFDEQQRQIAHFVANVNRFESGESLVDRIV